MKLSDFEYYLPKELIAQDPIAKRDESKLLVIDKKTGELSHHIFKDIINYVNSGDTLVLNETKVIPARLIGNIVGTSENVGEDIIRPHVGASTASPTLGRVCEVFLVKRISDKTWECLVRPGKKLKVGAKASFGDGRLTCEIKDIVEDGNRIVEFSFDGIFEEILDSLGEMPLPPYITHKLVDKNRYQTVYAKNEGSVAAPTAGLHFTKELLKELEDKGVNVVYVTLHVSLGTFRPVHVENVEEHHMHTEEFHVPQIVADKVNEAKLTGHKVICVGTTSVRSIESAAYYDEDKKTYLLKKYDGETNIYIYPGYEYKLVDSLITNFHLPGSTLIMLVSALSTREIVLKAYEEAVKEKYRFYSFGDACFFH
ncbi:MAG: tRNA preQ1(34) S-adenosylmethionine ribosyltransferase-isomerase QueA [Lachnospiraceae bacterium]|nr:tRNA preQ1(34) S-adenosylmethionine ribosyltransferase-isomerase QueA [Lachnospiraceae bacterium]